MSDPRLPQPRRGAVGRSSGTRGQTRVFEVVFVPIPNMGGVCTGPAVVAPEDRAVRAQSVVCFCIGDGEIVDGGQEVVSAY